MLDYRVRFFFIAVQIFFIYNIGTPELLLSFTNPHILSDCSFHPCIRYVSLSRGGIDNKFMFI